MVSNEDWKACVSSEVFREYLKNQVHKEAAQENFLKESEELILNDFEEFENRVKNNPQLKTAFKKIQEKLSSDPDYRSKVSARFIDGVMMLDLD